MSPSILPTYKRASLAFERGQGSWLITKDGDRYLDLGAGIAVNALGHANSELVEALTYQANKLWHVSNLYEIPEQQRLGWQPSQTHPQQHPEAATCARPGSQSENPPKENSHNHANL